MHSRKRKNIILQEAWAIYKNEKHIAFRRKNNQNMFSSFPDRLRLSSPLGWPDSIEKIGHADIKIYKDSLVRENLSVVISGNISKRHINVIKKYIELIPSGKQSKEVLIPKIVKPPLERIWIHTYEEMGLTSK